jgi:uncharacterized hydrophobic protein (TIGR00271 family)
VRRTLPELQDALFLTIGDVRRKMSRFWILLLLSAVIASAGILANSTAIVIGAMIIAPLGTPLMGIALAIVIGRGGRLWRSTALALGSTAAVILVGAFLAWIFPKLQPLAENGQITARTSPGVIDLVAAVATGVAGAYGVARRDVSDVMPGVAIAISLIPPLAVVGITGADGDWNDALGAFQSGREQIWLDRAAATARGWAADGHYAFDGVSFQGSQLNVVVEGSGPGPSTGQLLRRLRHQLPPGTAVVLDTINGMRVLIGHVPS